DAILHHEIAIIIHGALLFLVSLGSANQVAAETFLLLYVMRVSAKLLVFFGAPNIPAHFLPDRIAYFATYFRRSASPAAAIVALGFTTLLFLLIGNAALAAPEGSFSQIAHTLLASLAGLAVIEHFALVVRVPDQSLWAWAVRTAPDGPKPKP
ncbi:MAG: DUF3623 family protein, partial [Parvularcula sp.]|nr:DUF3623 family protein [Parvularcula sp.]